VHVPSQTHPSHPMKGHENVRDICMRCSMCVENTFSAVSDAKRKPGTYDSAQPVDRSIQFKFLEIHLPRARPDSVKTHENIGSS